MGTPRPCGCKGVRTCLVCETEYGVHKRDFEVNEKRSSYVYCQQCKKAWRGWDVGILAEHPNHSGDPINFSGIYIQLNFLSSEEQSQLINEIDQQPWDLSQSGRRKQNYGPKCNFKKRKLKPGEFNGFPKFSEFIQQRFRSVPLLNGFQTVEQCTLEYTSERGASIDPHVDDCWVWGERVVTVNVIGDSVLTLNRYRGTHDRYNLADVQTYPRVLNDNGEVIWKSSLAECISGDKEMKTNLFNNERVDHSMVDENCSNPHLMHQKASSSFSKSSNKNVNVKNTLSTVSTGDDCDSACDSYESYCLTDNSKDDNHIIVRVPMPARSLLVLHGAPRYDWEHSVLREDITQRRVCLAYREFTPPFLRGGQKENIGLEIIQKALNFW